MRTIFKYFVVAASLVITLSSCNDWLKVEMEDGIMEEALYSTNEGYLTTLNGIYSGMNSAYVPFLTMGAVDVMAQYYNVQRSQGHPYYAFANYAYAGSTFDNASTNYWSRVYNLILNANQLLELCDKQDATLLPRYHDMVKGEALALRAMLHFDLLRFYGPIYSQQTASVETMPYLETAKREIQDILPANQVVEKIQRDLNAAEQLLQNDSVRTYGVRSSETEDINANNNFRYRQYRLNYYAVRALQARLYMWTGDKAKAFEIVKQLLSEIEQKQVFPWVLPQAVSTSVSTQDNVFSTEVIFALYNMSRESAFNSLYSSDNDADGLHFIGGLAGGESKVEEFFGEYCGMDYRKNQWISETNEDGKEFSYLNKYSRKTAQSNAHWRYMVPLIRVSELYLMAAECTSDLDEAANYINTVRLHRSANNVTPTQETLSRYIQEEFARETLGEGQLFFYYKRHATEQMKSGTAVNAYYNMNVDLYQVPLPKSELNFDR